MSYGYVYLIKDHFTHKVYVGQSKVLTKINSYLGSGKLIKQIVLNRPQHLEKIILGFCESKKELDDAEKICIEFFQSNNERYGYNITYGGRGVNYQRTKEHSKKISVALKGRKLSEKQKAQISNFQKGKTLEEKLGKEKAEIVKRKISSALKNRTFSRHHRENLSKAIMGKRFSEEQKSKMRQTRKKVDPCLISLNRCKTNITTEIIQKHLSEEKTVKEIACILQCSSVTIRKRLKGITPLCLKK